MWVCAWLKGGATRGLDTALERELANLKGKLFFGPACGRRPSVEGYAQALDLHLFAHKLALEAATWLAQK